MSEKTYNCNRGAKNSCYYATRLNNGNIVICDYLCKTGKRRGCDPKECDKFIHRITAEKMKGEKDD